MSVTNGPAGTLGSACQRGKGQSDRLSGGLSSLPFLTLLSLAASSVLGVGAAAAKPALGAGSSNPLRTEDKPPTEASKLAAVTQPVSSPGMAEQPPEAKASADLGLTGGEMGKATVLLDSSALTMSREPAPGSTPPAEGRGVGGPPSPGLGRSLSEAPVAPTPAGEDHVIQALGITSVRVDPPVATPATGVPETDSLGPFEEGVLEALSQVPVSGTEGALRQSGSAKEELPRLGTLGRSSFGVDAKASASSGSATPAAMGDGHSRDNAMPREEAGAPLAALTPKSEGRDAAAEAFPAVRAERRPNSDAEGEAPKVSTKRESGGLTEVMQSTPQPRGETRTYVPQEAVVRQARSLARTLLEESSKTLPRAVEIKLDPPELGRVTVLLSQRGQEVTVRFSASAPAGQRVLSSALPDLQRALMQNGLTLSSFSVDGGPPDSGRQNRGGSSSQRKYNRRLDAASLAQDYRLAGDNVFDMLA